MSKFIQYNNSYFKFGYLFVLSLLLLLPSCKNDDQNLPTEAKATTKLPINKDTTSNNGNDGGNILAKVIPMLQYSTYGSQRYTYDWRLDHYEPKPGKIVGIWPSEYSTSNLAVLRTYWGYSKIQMGADPTIFNSCLDAGYTRKDIMIGVGGVPDPERRYCIERYGDVYAYYIDEPYDQTVDYSKNPPDMENNPTINGVKDYIIKYNFTSLFITSGYKRTDMFNMCADYVDIVMFSSYIHWYYLTGFWISWPEDLDQRPDWSDMLSRYGSKFSMTWINTSEISEFDDLFGHAQNLGLSGVWIYACDSHQTDQLGYISAAAYSHGFLRRFCRQWKNIYQCINPDGTSTLPPGSDWTLIGAEETNNVNEQ